MLQGGHPGPGKPVAVRRGRRGGCGISQLARHKPELTANTLSGRRYAVFSLKPLVSFAHHKRCDPTSCSKEVEPHALDSTLGILAVAVGHPDTAQPCDTVLLCSAPASPRRAYEPVWPTQDRNQIASCTGGACRAYWTASLAGPHIPERLRQSANRLEGSLRRSLFDSCSAEASGSGLSALEAGRPCSASCPTRCSQRRRPSLNAGVSGQSSLRPTVVRFPI